MEPDILLADEPTGNLDSSSGQDIMSLFTDLWAQGSTIIVITHDPALAKRADRQIEIHDGNIH
jgi:putative ABC transport system ATP-binding protein